MHDIRSDRGNIALCAKMPAQEKNVKMVPAHLSYTSHNLLDYKNIILAITRRLPIDGHNNIITEQTATLAFFPYFWLISTVRNKSCPQGRKVRRVSNTSLIELGVAHPKHSTSPQETKHQVNRDEGEACEKSQPTSENKYLTIADSSCR